MKGGQKMKVLLLYDYPPSPGGLATQGDLLYKGLLELGVDAHAAHFAAHSLQYAWGEAILFTKGR